MPTLSRKPLEGKRVVEFGTGYVAPVASMYLGLLGADVLKIEHRQTPDFMRGDVRVGDGLTSSFIDVNRGKRSVAIDAKTEQGRDLLAGLMQQADVLVENLGGGAMNRLGFAYADVRALKSDIIMASLQGLGADVEHSTTLGQNIPPLIGLTYLWNHPGAARPVGSQLFHPDYFAGVFSAALIVAALDHRRRTGCGHFIDAAQAEVAASLLGPLYRACELNAEPPRPVGNSGARGVPAGCFPCVGDDEWCVIVVHDDDEWRALKAVGGMARWAHDRAFDSIIGRLRNRERLEVALRDWTRTQSATALLTTLQGKGVPCGVVHRVRKAVTDQQLLHQGFIQSLDQPELGRAMAGGMPVTLGATAVRANGRCPVIGEHTAQVLQECLGLGANEIEKLAAQKIIELGVAAKPAG